MLNMSREREAMKSQIMKLEQDVERSKTLVTSLREERDNWRKKVNARYVFPYLFKKFVGNF